MRNSLAHSAGQSRDNSTDRIATICVVDPHTGDYAGWQSLAEAHDTRLHFAASAEEALRFSRSQPVSLWVVNTQLSGLSGFELCGMLKSRSASATVFLVSDEYSPTAERAAWAAKATLFGGKPAHATWLAEWLGSQAMRASASTAAVHEFAASH